VQEYIIPSFYVPFNKTELTGKQTDFVVSRIISSLACSVESHSFSIPLTEPALATVARLESETIPLKVSLDDSACSVMKRRQFIVAEIIATEEEFLAGIKTILSVWEPKLKKVIQPEHLHVLFRDFSGIEMCHGSFLKNLNMAGSTYAAEVGTAFLEFSQAFKVSQQYIAHFPNVVEILCDYEKKSKVQQLMCEIQMMPACNGRDLRSYLITPVQRMPRYILFLKDLLKNTPISHPDSEFLKAAFEAVELVTQKIDTVTADASRREALVRMQKNVVNYKFVTPQRELRMEKSVKIGAVTGSFYLFNDLLLIVREKKVVHDSPVRKFTYRPVNSTTFVVDSAGRSYMRGRRSTEFTIVFEKESDFKDVCDQLLALQKELVVRNPNFLYWDTSSVSLGRPKVVLWNDVVFVLSVQKSHLEVWRLCEGKLKEETRLNVPKSASIAASEHFLVFFAGSSLTLYDPKNQRSEIRPVSMSNRRGCSALVFNERLWLFGGKTGRRSYVNDFMSIGMEQNMCSGDKSPRLPSARAWHSAAVCNGKMFVFGGKNNDGVLMDLYAYDFSTAEWLNIEIDGLLPRRRHVCAVCEGCLILIGGRDDGDSNQICNIAESRARCFEDFGNTPAQPRFIDGVYFDKKLVVFSENTMSNVEITSEFIKKDEVITSTSDSFELDVSDDHRFGISVDRSMPDFRPPERPFQARRATTGSEEQKEIALLREKEEEEMNRCVHVEPPVAFHEQLVVDGELLPQTEPVTAVPTAVNGLQKKDSGLTARDWFFIGAVILIGAFFVRKLVRF
jgi:hypothetical protein